MPLRPASLLDALTVVCLGLKGTALIGAMVATCSGYSIHLGAGVANGKTCHRFRCALTLACEMGQKLSLLLAGVIMSVVLGAVKDLLTIRFADISVALTGFMLGNTGLVG